MHAKERHAGKKGKCPACKRSFRVPDAAPEEAPVGAVSAAESPPIGPFGLDDLHALADGEASEEPIAPVIRPMASPPAPAAGDDEYGLVPDEPPPPVLRPLPTGGGKGSAGAFVGDCFASLGWGIRNMPNVLILLIAYSLVGAGLGVVVVLSGAVLVQTVPGVGLLGFLVLMFYLVMGGYVLRYLLDITDSAAEGYKDTVPAPRWEFGSQMGIAVKWIGLLFVYVYPIVTIPLLPLGIMALAHTGDGRAFDLIWAIRAACKRPGRLIGLWCILLLLGLIGMIVLLLVGAAGLAIAGEARSSGPGTGDRTLWGVVTFVMLAVMAVLFFSVACVAHRCIGLLGCHDSRLLAMLPDHPNGMVATGFVGLGIAMAIGVHVYGWSSLSKLARGLEDADRPRFSRRGDSDIGSYGSGQRYRPVPPTESPVSRLMGESPSELRIRSRRQFEAVADKLKLYVEANDGLPPTSLEELERVTGLKDADLRSPGDPSLRYELVTDLVAGWSHGNQIVLYDPFQHERGYVHFATLNGEVKFAPGPNYVLAMVSSQERAARKESLQRTSPKLLPGESAGPANLRQLGAALYRYAERNGWRFPRTLEDIRSSGDLRDEARLRSAGDPNRSIVYIPGQHVFSPAGNILAYDPVPAKDRYVVAVRVDGTVLSCRDLDALRTKLAAQTPGGPELTINLPPVVPYLPEPPSPPAPPEPPKLTDVSVPMPEPVPPPAPPKKTVPRRAVVRGDVDLRQESWMASPANLRNLYADLYAYAADHDGKFPPSLKELQDGGYVKDLTDLRCLAEPARSYMYIPGRDVWSDPELILAFDPADHKRTGGRKPVYAVTVGGTVRMFDTRNEIARLNLKQHSHRPVSLALPPPEPPETKVPPVASRPAVPTPAPPDGGVVKWDMPYWYDGKLDDDHPFLGFCHLVRQVREQGTTGVLGVAFGPTAKDKPDGAYVRFYDEAVERFDANGGQVSGGVRDKRRHRISEVEYDRITVIRGTQILALYTGIEDGRCVSYWYFGSRTPFPKFVDAVGKARLEVEKK
ncbi:MAG TPA: hypothetical protein VFJ30_10365 [Phycisphaerae bacterium]|nr:hypothetical protein [Phycisphaerae bacterium]